MTGQLLKYLLNMVVSMVADIRMILKSGYVCTISLRTINIKSVFTSLSCISSTMTCDTPLRPFSSFRNKTPTNKTTHYIVICKTNSSTNYYYHCHLPTVQNMILPYGLGKILSNRTLYPILVPNSSWRSFEILSATDTADIPRGCVTTIFAYAPWPARI